MVQYIDEDYWSELFDHGVDVINNEDYKMSIGYERRGQKVVYINVKKKIPVIPGDTVFMKIVYPKKSKTKTKIKFPKVPSSLIYLEIEGSPDKKIPKLNSELLTLYITRWNNLKTINDISYIKKLEEIFLRNCEKFEKINSFNLPARLEYLSVINPGLPYYELTKPVYIDKLDFKFENLDGAILSKKKLIMDL